MEVLAFPLKMFLVHETKDYVKKLLIDEHGNHVMQKIVTNMQGDNIYEIMYVIEAIQNEMHKVSTNIYGCRVVQRLIENSKPFMIKKLLEEIHGQFYQLSRDTYGNFVIQSIILHGLP